MTLEELQAQIEELKSSNDAMASKNKELLAEVKKERQKAKEVDVDVYHSTLDELESVKSENAKLNGTIKTIQKDFEKVSGDLSKKDAYLNKTLLNDTLARSLLESGVDKDYLDGAQALLERRAKVLQNGDDYSATIDDKPMSDFVKEWVANEGKKYTMVQPDTGAGARGGSDKTAQTQDVSGLSPIEMMKAGRNTPTK